MSKSVNVDFVTRQIEVDTDGKEYYVSAAVAAKDAEQSMLSAQNAASVAEASEVVVRSLATRVTPQLFGALADGEHDDYEAIIAAINSLNDGDTLYFPAGIYYISQGLVIDKYIYIKGETFNDMGSAYSNQNLALMGSVICFKNRANDSIIKVTNRGGISDISVIGRSYWINEHSAPDTTDTYFNKRTEEIWQENVNGIDCSQATPGYRLNNVHAYECSGSGIIPPPYGQAHELNAKLCKIGINCSKVDTMISSIKVQSADIGIRIANNGIQVHGGRVEECITGCRFDAGIDINISNLTFDQISKSAYKVMAGRISINNSVISRSGQNTCTYSLENIPQEYWEDSCAIYVVGTSRLVTNNIVVHKTKYDDNDTVLSCPKLVFACVPVSDYEDIVLRLHFNTINLQEGYRIGDYIKKLYKFADNYKGSACINDFGHTYTIYQSGNNGVELLDSYGLETTLNKEAAVKGEIRYVNDKFYISTGYGTETFKDISNPLGDKNVTFVEITEESKTTNVNITASVVGNRVVGMGTFQATSTQGWTYGIAEFANCDRKISSQGVITKDGNEFMPITVSGSKGGVCLIQYGMYEVVSGATYKIYLF